MDANETRFHMLFGRSNWQPLLERGEEEASGLAWDDDTNSVILSRRLFRFERSPSEVPPSLDHRKGSAIDRYGNWYWISETGDEIFTLPAGLKVPERLWPAGDRKGAAPRPGTFSPVQPPPIAPTTAFSGLAVTDEHYLVAGTLEPAGIVIFDLHAGGPPLWVAWPEKVPFSPFDMVARPGGGLYILDRKERRYWILDRNFVAVRLDQERVETEAPLEFHFHPEGKPKRQPAPARTLPSGIALESADEIGAFDPISIEALPDGSVLILDIGHPNARVHRYVGGRLLGVAEFAGIFEDQPFTAFDFAFIASSGAGGAKQDRLQTEQSWKASIGVDQGGGPVAGTLYIVGEDGNQAFAFSLSGAPDAGVHSGEKTLELALEMRYLPMRSFGGRGLVPVWGTTGANAVYYDRVERGGIAWIELVEMPRSRYETNGVLAGVGMPVEAGGFTLLAFDGKERGCVWHRVLLDAIIPKGAGIAVESRATDDPSSLASTPWQREPDPYLRPMGAEIPYYRPFQGLEGGGCEGAGTWELLLQEARGRYLQLRISFVSNGRTTPRLKALRIYYPRFSYLEAYLPGVYREDPASASFLDRFLANPEGIYTALEDRIANVQYLLDPRTTPPEYLDWLGGWLGICTDSSWDERRKRLLIRHAPQMFRERGTAAGIVRAIRLATDPCPSDDIFTQPVSGSSRWGARGVRIVEQFLTRRSPGVVFGDPSQVEGPGVTTPHAPWSPAQGADPLHRRYRQFLMNRYGDIGRLNASWETDYVSEDEIEFTPVMPDGTAQAEDWRIFVGTAVGFTYEAVETGDEGAYQRFLEQRYRRVKAFAAASPHYASLGVSSFRDVRLPDRLPPSGPPLVDWIQFASIYLPTLKRAHRFIVLVPIVGEVGLPPGHGSAAGGRLWVGPDPEVVQRVIELEKPAHTEFEIRPYWAMFRVGEARLGIDTQLGQGSRLGSAVVGQGALGEQYLAYTHPWNVRERMIVGRDRLCS